MENGHVLIFIALSLEYLFANESVSEFKFRYEYEYEWKLMRNGGLDVVGQK